MTVWDSMNLNAPHTERELPQDENSWGLDMAIRCASCGARHHSLPEMWPNIGATVATCPNCRPATLRELAAEADTTPSGTTEPQDATSPSAGLSGAYADDLIRRGDVLALFEPVTSMVRKRLQEDINAIAASKPATDCRQRDFMTAARIVGAWLGEMEGFASRRERMFEAISNPSASPMDVEWWLIWACMEGMRHCGKEVMPNGTQANQPATSPGVTAGAVLAIVTAEKANWPHAGAMHDGARMACNNIIRQLQARGE